MRKLFAIAILLTIPFCFTCAQKDVLKQAKATLKTGDVKELQKLVDKIIVNPETMKMPETWYVAGRVQQRKSEQQMEKAYLRKPYDTLTIYNSALNMSKYFLICDSLAQQGMKPGKINKYRKDNQRAIMADKGNLLATTRSLASHSTFSRHISTLLSAICSRTTTCYSAIPSLPKWLIMPVWQP